MKTYHNEADSGGITKIASEFFFWNFLDKVDRFRKITSVKLTLEINYFYI